MRRGLLLAAACAGAFLPALVLGACGGGKTAVSPVDATAPPTTPVPSTEAPRDTPSAQPSATVRTRADCPKLAESTVEMPPLDAGVMSNAQADAAFDRNATDVNALVQRSRDRFRCCYDVSQREHPGIQGEFVLDFVLKPDGSLKSSSYNKEKSQIKDDAMGDCAIEVLKTITFPASKKGKETTVSYPFGFKPKGAR